MEINKNGIIKHVNVNGKIIISLKKDYSWNPNTCICENTKYLISVTNTSMAKCHEIVIVMNSLSMKCYKYCFNKSSS